MSAIISDATLIQEQVRSLCAGPEESFDLAEAALLMAALRHPGIDLAPYRLHLASMVEATADLVRRRGASLDTLRQVVAASYGYRGDTDTYDDLQNADFVRVIDRRKGLPVALSILYMHVARAQGWDCVGLSFPGHFLIRLDCEDARLVLDPFYGGIAREANDMRQLLKTVGGNDAELSPRFFDAVPDQEVLLRLENNTRGRLLQRGDKAGAIDTLDRMLLVARDRPDLLYEHGMMCAELERTRAALVSLDRFMAVTREGDAHANARYRVAKTLETLRRRLN